MLIADQKQLGEHCERSGAFPISANRLRSHQAGENAWRHPAAQTGTGLLQLGRVLFDSNGALAAAALEFELESRGLAISTGMFSLPLLLKAPQRRDYDRTKNYLSR